MQGVGLISSTSRLSSGERPLDGLYDAVATFLAELLDGGSASDDLLHEASVVHLLHLRRVDLGPAVRTAGSGSVELHPLLDAVMVEYVLLVTAETNHGLIGLKLPAADGALFLLLQEELWQVGSLLSILLLFLLCFSLALSSLGSFFVDPSNLSKSLILNSSLFDCSTLELLGLWVKLVLQMDVCELVMANAVVLVLIAEWVVVVLAAVEHSNFAQRLLLSLLEVVLIDTKAAKTEELSNEPQTNPYGSISDSLKPKEHSHYFKDADTVE